MDWQQAQRLLTGVTIALGFVGFFATLIFYVVTDNEHDWAERIARAAFVWLQCALWGAVVGFMVMALSGVDFGGIRG